MPEVYNSQFILKGLTRLCPDIKFVAAFSLAIGSVSIYSNSLQDRDKVLEKLANKSFGGGIQKTHSPYKSKWIFLKGVDTSINEETIESFLTHIASGILIVRRHKNISNEKSGQVVKVACTQEAAENIASQT